MQPSSRARDRRARRLAAPLWLALALAACDRPAPPARHPGHPDVVAAVALQRLSLRDQEALLGPGSSKGGRTRVLVAPDDPSAGPPLAPLVLVEFVDLSVAPSRAAWPVVAELRARARTDLRLVVKPIADPARPISDYTARAALIAAAHGDFWRFHDCVLDRSTDPGEVEVEACAALAGVAATTLRAELTATATAARLDAARGYANAVGVEGSPTFFLDGYPIRGAHPLARFERALALEAEANAELRDHGQPVPDAAIWVHRMRAARSPQSL